MNMSMDYAEELIQSEIDDSACQQNRAHGYSQGAVVLTPFFTRALATDIGTIASNSGICAAPIQYIISSSVVIIPQTATATPGLQRLRFLSGSCSRGASPNIRTSAFESQTNPCEKSRTYQRKALC